MKKLCAPLITCSVSLILAFSAARADGQQVKTIVQFQSELSKIDKSIEVTHQKMREIKDVSFLPDLYFVLAELNVEKSRYQYIIARQREPRAKIEEIDFSESRKTKKKSIEIYQRIIETFPKNDALDKATFYMAHEYREIGASEEMVKAYRKLVQDYPKSQFWEESELILGDYFLEQKKDPKRALDFYQSILRRPVNPFMPIARYKSGWCYINLEKFHEALLAFEGVLSIDANVSIEKLPDIYKKSDVRRDALVALVWPYSEEKTLDPFRADTLNYFESLSPNRPTLQKVLDKLSKRLKLKNKNEVVMPVYFRLIEITNNIDRKIEIIDRFYAALRQSKRAWPIEIIPDELTNTLLRARGSLEISQSEKGKIEKNFEIYLRDVTTRLQQRARANRVEKDFISAIRGYEDYLILFPNSRYLATIALNLAESYFSIKKYARAGYYYETLIGKSEIKTKKEILDSTLQSFALALKEPDKLSRLELTESREGFRVNGSKFITLFKNDKASPMIIFNIARTYYDERDFEKSVKWFSNFIASYPTHKDATTAGNLILDSYNQREDYEGLVKAGRRFIANKNINNQQFKNDVAEIIKTAEYRKIENAAGDPRSRDYTKKLLIFASKYSGTTLGDQALYEAFVSLKLKKDPQAYEPGEQLLTKHGDSRYAKEVVSAMGQIALNTSDYRRTAKYFELFAKKYPKDAASFGLLKNAASLHELLGDLKEASDDYRELGAQYTEDQARQFVSNQDWASLAQTLAARPINSLRGQYWLGLAFYRQGRLDQAKPYLLSATKSKALNYEEKKMAAHSLYLLSTQALKDYQTIQLGSGQNEAELVKSKKEKLSQLTAQFNRVILYGDGRWAIASLYQLGRAHTEFSLFILGAATPPGLSDSQKAQYKQLISQQAGQYKIKASQFFKACSENAEKYEVFTGFVRGCQSQGSQQVDESLEEKQITKASDTAPTDAAAIRQKLFDQPKDTRLLFDLAQSYLRARDYSFARAIYGRILELKPGTPRAEAELGTTFLFMNDFESAQQSFKRALSYNGSDPTALWGLAALYKNFEFANKYSQALSKATKSGRPTGVIHPWVQALLGDST